MEQRSPWVPAELVPFFSQHHKWSWSRPERSPVRLPLGADSIRNNCILASLHSTSFTNMVLHFTVFLCCKLQYGTRARGTLQHCCYCFFFNIHTYLDWRRSCTEPPLVLKHTSQQLLAFRKPQPLWSSFTESNNFQVLSYITSFTLALETLKVQWLHLQSKLIFLISSLI